jgi:formate dehydrogenase subunit gamma
MRYFERYRALVRMNHWAVAMLFICAGLTGLAFFHPLFFPLTAFFGGGSWTRILHPFFGVAMCLGFAALFAQVWRENFIKRTDVEWLKALPKLIRTADEDGMPPVGKYNPGQKLVFWAFGASLVLLFLTGFVFWQPWFADFFSVPLRRVAVVVHAASAFVLIMSVIAHVYAALWVKGTMRAMLRGTVSESWARHNHPLWYRKLTGRADN